MNSEENTPRHRFVRVTRWVARASMLAFALAGYGCADEVDFEDRRDELRDQLGNTAQVCPTVDESFPCDLDGPAGHRCIANALQACDPAELYLFGDDGEGYWFVVPSDDSCELVALSLRPALLSETRLRFGEQSCGAIEATPPAMGGCTSFSLRDCD